MGLVRNTQEVQEAVQRAKGTSPSFCTNFFPVPRKLQRWIEDGLLHAEESPGAVLFLRQDRDFWHLHFSAASLTSLGQALEACPKVKADRVVTDLVGQESTLAALRGVCESAGFLPRRRLYRMVRMADAGETVQPPEDDRIGFATASDAVSMLDLISQSFDPYSEQLPTLRELEEASAEGQILAVKQDQSLAGLLYFETQGLTSTVRYWLVAAAFRDQRFGAALMKKYFAVNQAVRRFILWVVADNEDAITKYRHYRFAPDGLVDYVLANAMIRA